MAIATAEDPRLPPELHELAGLARALPPEFAADVMLQVADRLGAPHRNKKRELLEDAFVAAGNAREPMPRRPVMPDPVLDAAYSQGLDRLTLQARAVRQMHGFDPKLALEYFQRLAQPPRDKLTCADRWVWDSSPYWETAAAIAAPDLRGVVSPLEIGPAAKAYRELKRPPAELLTGIDRLSGDDRAFAYAARSAPRDLETLAIDAKRAGVDPAPVLDTLAGYLRRHLAAARCADTAENARVAAESFAVYFNTRLRTAGYLSARELLPIREDEIAPGPVIPVENGAWKPEWMDEYRKLTTADAIEAAHSKLYDREPLVWWLAVKPLLQSGDWKQSSHLVLSTYARLR